MQLGGCGEIDPAVRDAGWRGAVRQRILSVREAGLRHPWARQVLESGTNRTPAVLEYMDTFLGMFLAGGFSADLTHHVLHALGSRMWGSTQELFQDPAGPDTEDKAEVAPEVQAAMFQEMPTRYPNIAQIAMAPRHDDGPVVVPGCDDQFEFEFALDLLPAGFARLHQQDWTSTRAKPVRE